MLFRNQIFFFFLHLTRIIHPGICLLGVCVNESPGFPNATEDGCVLRKIDDGYETGGAIYHFEYYLDLLSTPVT